MFLKVCKGVIPAHKAWPCIENNGKRYVYSCGAMNKEAEIAKGTTLLLPDIPPKIQQVTPELCKNIRNAFECIMATQSKEMKKNKSDKEKLKRLNGC